MPVNPYLTFGGQCAEAFRFYEKSLGGRITVMQTHGETPMKDATPAEWHNAVMHAEIVIDGTVLMGSDRPWEAFKPPQGFSVSLVLADPKEAERKFAALAAGGAVTMPLQETFWALRFGMLTDKFGVPWMVNCQGPS